MDKSYKIELRARCDNGEEVYVTFRIYDDESWKGRFLEGFARFLSGLGYIPQDLFDMVDLDSMVFDDE